DNLIERIIGSDQVRKNDSSFFFSPGRNEEADIGAVQQTSRLANFGFELANGFEFQRRLQGPDVWRNRRRGRGTCRNRAARLRITQVGRKTKTHDETWEDG